uniref:Uncharacterized protein n=1 Tax=viral metagenome TaxID=1070528 RepID=A0A6M3IXS4_9ZZZZ
MSKPVTPPKYDDVNKEYSKERNSLIPAAEAFANKYCGKGFVGDSEKEREVWNKKWSSTFIRRMNHLYSKIPRPCPTCGRLPE